MKLKDFRNAIFLHEYENDKKEIVLKFLKDIDETEESLCRLQSVVIGMAMVNG